MSFSGSFLKRFGIDMRKGEGAPSSLMFVAFFLIICWFYTARTVRQATFIDSLGSQWLPVVYLILALCSYPVLRLYGRYANRVPRHILMIISSLVVAATMVLFWWGFQFETTLVPIAFYVWLGIVSVLMVSQFWAYSGNVFDSRQAKRLFGFLGAGALLGGVAGGQVARIISNLMGTRYALLAAAFFLGLVALVMLLVHRMAPSDTAAATATGATGKFAKMDAAKGGFETIKNSRHLTLIAAVLTLTVVVAQIVDVQFNWGVEQAIHGKDALAAFYGNFFTVMNIAAFIFQLVLTSRIHRTLGVGFAMRILPASMAIGSVGLFVAFSAFPAALLSMAILLKISEQGLRYSLDQATRELLFLPVPANVRMKAKAFIDVFVQRGAKGIAAILLLPYTFGWIRAIDTVWISLVLIAVWLVVIGMMARQYVISFRDGLKKRAVDSAVPINVSDVTTLELLVESLGSADSRQVLHALNLLSSNDRGNLVPPLLLYHDDPEVRLRTLEILDDIGRSEAAPLIERRLGDEDPDVRAKATRTLARLEGQGIVDLMRDRLDDAEPSVRAAAVACMVNQGEGEDVDRARAVLREMLSDAETEARLEAARALGAIHEPEMQEQVIRLLYDTSPLVVRETILAIRRRVARDGFNPMYVPTLISLLHDRRLKSDAREALVAFGETVIPTLVHFMGAEDEPIWVRRALPKSIANIGTGEAAGVLIDSLERFEDRFLRRKVIEALTQVRDDEALAERREAIEAAVQQEIQKYFENLHSLSLVGLDQKGGLSGPEVDWSEGHLEPGLLEKLLAERMGEHLHNVFGLLATIYTPHDIWASYRSLLSGQPALRNNALEYIDNTVSAGLRQMISPMLDNRPLADKLSHARSLASALPANRKALLADLMAREEDGEAAESGLRVSVMYYIYTEGVADLYAAITETRETTNDPFVAETADWVASRVA